METITDTEVMKRLHQMIDVKFNRTDRMKKINPFLLEAKMTLWSITGEFVDEDPVYIGTLLRQLVQRGSIVTNLAEGVYPLDAYFIPKVELIDKEDFKIYARIKNILHK